MARARAASQGRVYVSDDDIKSVAPQVMAHRMILRPEAVLQGTNTEAVVADVLRAVPVPYDRV